MTFVFIRIEEKIMVENISNFCMSIICTIMLLIVLEMIIPEGKSKKYVTFVCGIVVTLVLIEPIINLFDINIEEVLVSVSAEYEEVKIDESLYENSVKKSYEQTLINDIIIRLKENGYNVSNVKVEYDEESLKPTRVYMNLENNEDKYIQPVKIEVSATKINSENTIRERTD